MVQAWTEPVAGRQSAGTAEAARGPCGEGWARARIWAAKSGSGGNVKTASKAWACASEYWQGWMLDDMTLAPFIGFEKLGQGAWQVAFHSARTHM